MEVVDRISVSPTGAAGPFKQDAPLAARGHPEGGTAGRSGRRANRCHLAPAPHRPHPRRQGRRPPARRYRCEPPPDEAPPPAGSQACRRKARRRRSESVPAQTLFASDLHLDSERPLGHRRFPGFSRRPCTRRRRAVPAGRPLEAWVGDDDDNADNARLRRPGATDTRGHRRVRHARHRDFLLGHELRTAATGVKLLPDPVLRRPARHRDAAQPRRCVLHRRPALPGAAPASCASLAGDAASCRCR